MKQGIIVKIKKIYSIKYNRNRKKRKKKRKGKKMP
jgi:hypothetical protein